MIQIIKDKERIKKRRQLKEGLQKWKFKKIKNKIIYLNKIIILIRN